MKKRALVVKIWYIWAHNYCCYDEFFSIHCFHLVLTNDVALWKLSLFFPLYSKLSLRYSHRKLLRRAVEKYFFRVKYGLKAKIEITSTSFLLLYSAPVDWLCVLECIEMNYQQANSFKMVHGSQWGISQSRKWFCIIFISCSSSFHLPPPSSSLMVLKFHGEMDGRMNNDECCWGRERLNVIFVLYYSKDVLWIIFPSNF